MATATTNEHGLFLSSAFSAKNGNFRVTASGGTLNGNPIIGTLRAHVRNYKFGETVHINGVTTLVSAYFDATPGITLEEAETAVGNFLQLSGTELGSAYAPEDGKAFSHVVFHEEASDETHINAFIDSLVVEMKANNFATHHFKGTTSNSAGAAKGMNSRALSKKVRERRTDNNPGMNLLVGVVNGALGKDGGIALSQALANAGDVVVQTATKKALNQIQGELFDLKHQVAELKLGVIAGTYQTIVSNNADFLGKIDSTIDSFTTISNFTPQYCADKNKTYCDTMISNHKIQLAALTTDLSGLSVTKLHDLMMGTIPLSEPIINLASQLIAGNNRAFYNKQDSDNYFLVMDYWQSKQIALFSLILAQLDINITPQDVKTAAVTLFSGDVSGKLYDTTFGPVYVPGQPAAGSQLGQQNAKMKRPLPIGTVIEKARSIMWYVGTTNEAPIAYVTFKAGKDALVQLNSTSLFKDWKFSRTGIPTVTDQNKALFHPYCDTKANTLAKLHEQGWPKWDWVNNIGGDSQGYLASDNAGELWWSVMWIYELNNCAYTDFIVLDHTTSPIYFDFIPYREISEGVGTYLYSGS